MAAGSVAHMILLFLQQDAEKFVLFLTVFYVRDEVMGVCCRKITNGRLGSVLSVSVIL